MASKLYINGKCVEGKGAPIDIVNPATGKVVKTIRGASVQQAEEALQAAKKAFRTWSYTSLNERDEWIQKLKAEILKEKDAIIDIMAEEGGRTEAFVDFNALPENLDYCREEAKRIYDIGLPELGGHRNSAHIVLHRPVGVVVGHLAWNAPFFNLGTKLSAALASGCTCVLRPSTATPLATFKIGEICERVGLPDGVVNFITGPSGEIGSYLSKSPIPSMVGVIGSATTGMQVIADGATSSVKRYSMELGGNAPAILMPDCTLDDAVNWIAHRKHFNAGQGCANVNRIFVHESIHDKFVEKLLPIVKSIPVGWGKDVPPSTMGALINKGARDRMLSMVEDAVKSGAKLLYGGVIPDNLSDELKDGAFILPAVLDECTDDMRVAREEIFGPIYAIYTFKELDEVIERANNSDYGLSGYVYTHDARVMLKCAEELECGEINFNCPNSVGPNLPHVGMKNSGLGSVCGKWAMEEYYHIRRISIQP